MFFMFAGMKKTLPWATCKDDYNSIHCYSVEEAKDCDEDGGTEVFFNKQCTSGMDYCSYFNYTYDPAVPGYCFSSRYMLNSSGPIPFVEVTYRTSSSEDYWYKRVLGLEFENGCLDTNETWWGHWGSIRWELIGYLIITWIIICFTLIKGMKFFGKLAYFITLFPYVVLTLMLGYVATLDGFDKGLEYYMVPKDLDKLLSGDIWYTAASQIFYSLSVGSGGQLVMASFNDFRNNCHRDAILISMFNSLTSIYAGFSVFGVIGFLSVTKNMPMDDVVTQGAGLAFIVYPEALTQMNPGPMYSFFFFFMLNLLGLSSICGSHEAVIMALLDEFTFLRKKRIMVVVGICFISFCGGIAICFDAGFLLFTLMDSKAGNAMLLMGLMEIVISNWLYGTRKIFRHLKEMEMWMPRGLKYFWMILFGFVTPALLTALTLAAWITAEPSGFEGYIFPPGVQFMGWGLELFALAVFLAFGVYTTIDRYRNGKPIDYLKTGTMLQSTPLWGPRPESGLNKKAKALDNVGYESDN